MINSLEELEGKSVAVHRSGIMHDYLVRRTFAASWKLTDTPADAVRFLAAGTSTLRGGYCAGHVLISELKLTNVVPVVRNVAAIATATR